jgi:hypothetical protein
MNCSGCGGVIKPVVAIDIDGTLGDYHGQLLKFTGDWLGLRYLPAGRELYDGSEPFGEWFCETFGVDRTTFRAIKLAFRQGGQKRMMPLFTGPHPRLLVEGVQAEGAEVWLTTTRPWERFDRVDPDTREWLRRHRIPFDALLYDDDKMDRLADAVDPRRVVAVLDDQEDILRAAVRRGWPAVKRATPYNAAVEWPDSVDRLDLALQRITTLIYEWRQQHA